MTGGLDFPGTDQRNMFLLMAAPGSSGLQKISLVNEPAKAMLPHAYHRVTAGLLCPSPIPLTNLTPNSPSTSALPLKKQNLAIKAAHGPSPPVLPPPGGVPSGRGRVPTGPASGCPWDKRCQISFCITSAPWDAASPPGGG